MRGTQLAVLILAMALAYGLGAGSRAALAQAQGSTGNALSEQDLQGLEEGRRVPGQGRVMGVLAPFAGTPSSQGVDPEDLRLMQDLRSGRLSDQGPGSGSGGAAAAGSAPQNPSGQDAAGQATSAPQATQTILAVSGATGANSGQEIASPSEAIWRQASQAWRNPAPFLGNCNSLDREGSVYHVACLRSVRPSSPEDRTALGYVWVPPNDGGYYGPGLRDIREFP
jgi:hypothetical protein